MRKITLLMILTIIATLSSFTVAGIICEDPFDSDCDTINDTLDNCPFIYNINQADTDGDGVGDVCDNCPLTANTNQADADGDGVGDVCDNCPAAFNDDQADGDGDGVGDVCDNCPSNANTNQSDSDSDGVGDVCDNCVETFNPTQTDLNLDGTGDICEEGVCGGDVPCECGDTLIGSRILNGDDSLSNCEEAALIIGYDNLTLDCNGTILSNGSSVGINIFHVDGTSIFDCEVKEFTTGILVNSAEDTLVQGNVVANNTDRGIAVVFGDSVTVSQNIIGGNYNDGLYVGDSVGVAVTDNEIFYNGAGLMFDANIPVSNHLIQGNYIHNNENSNLEIFNEDDITITENVIECEADIAGIYIEASYDIEIYDNEISKCFEGIDIEESWDIDVTEDLSDNIIGLYVGESGWQDAINPEIRVTDSSIHNNCIGLYAMGGSYVDVIYSDFIENRNYTYNDGLDCIDALDSSLTGGIRSLDSTVDVTNGNFVNNGDQGPSVITPIGMYDEIGDTISWTVNESVNCINNTIWIYGDLIGLPNIERINCPLYVDEEKPIGVVGVDLVYPNTNLSVIQKTFFNFTVNVTCSDEGDCGNVTVALDPPTDECYGGCVEIEINGGVVLMDSIPRTGYFTYESARNTCLDLGGDMTNFDESYAWVYWNGQSSFDIPYYSYDPSSGLCEANPAWGYDACCAIEMDHGFGWHDLYGCTCHDCPSTIEESIPSFGYVCAYRNKGIISMNTSETPFYTTTQNPMGANYFECLSMYAGDLCQVTWEVNPTGTHNSEYDFYVLYNSTEDSEQKESDKVKIKIIDLDFDDDGVLNDVDNCINTPNTNQSNRDGDELGDACDNCDLVTNPDQADFDDDGIGNKCDYEDWCGEGYGECDCGDLVKSDVLLENHLYCDDTALYIFSDDMTLDCDGYRIIGDYDDYGIYLEGYTGVTIQNCIISEFDTGIYMDGDNYTVTIKDNEIYDNDYGSIFGMAETNLIATITGNYITGEDDDGCGPEDPGGAIRLQGKNDSLSIITATLTNNVIEYDEGGAVRIGWSNEGATSKETYVDFFSNNIRSFDYEGDGSPIRLNAIEYIDADIRNNEVRGEGTEDACPSAIGFTPDGGDETVYNIKLTLLGNTFRNIPGLKVIALDNIDAEIRDNTFDRVLTPFRLGFCSSFEPVENLTAIVSGNDFYDIEGGSIVARSVGSTDMKAYNNYIDYTRGGGRGAIEAYSEGFTNAEIYDNTIINSGHNNAIWVEGEDIGTVNVYRNNVQSFIEEYCDYSDCTMKRAFYMYGNEDNESDINIYDNEFSMSGYGMHLESVFGAVLSNNDIQNNCEGIYLDSSEVTIEDTDFIGNNPEELGFCEGGDTTGLYVSGDSIAYLKNSNFANNGEYGLLDEGPFSVYWSLYKDVSCINNDAFFYGWLIPFGGSITTENCTITIRSDEIEFEHVLNTSNGESGAVGFDLDMENGSGIVGGKDQGIELEIHAEESKNEGIEVIFYNENPGNDTYDFKAFGKWVDVNTPTDLNLSYWILKLYYTDEELVKSGIPEETLLIEYFNETSESWEKYETPRGGVNTAENYVWANITHFSIFGLFGSEPTCSDGVLNQDEVGVDCGGVCGGYWYDDSCHTSPKTTSSGGSSGGTTCSIISDNCTEWSECSSDGTRSKSCTYEDCPTSSTEVSEECIYIENTPGDISDPSEGDDDLQKKIDDAKEQVKQLTEEESPEGEDEERSNLLTGQVVGGEGSGSLMPVWIVLFILGIAIVGSVGYFWFIKK